VERLSRVRRDHQDGALDAADWKEQRVELTAELEDGTVAVERACTRLHALEGSDLDYTHAALTSAVELHAAMIAGLDDEART
jgi:hypothetical protein